MQRKKGQEISGPLDRCSSSSTSRAATRLADRQLSNFTARPVAPLPVGGCGVIAEDACGHSQLALPSWLRCLAVFGRTSTLCLKVTIRGSSGEHTNRTEELSVLRSSFLGVLLDEERFPKLISADEGLHRAKSAEQVLNLAVLVNLLCRAQYRRRNDLQRIRIRDPVALKTFRLLAVE